MRDCAVPLPYVITRCFYVLYFLSRSSRFFRLESHIMQFNAIFGGGAADSERRRFVEQTYAEEVQVHEILSVDVKETHGEETHRVILISCINDLLALV